MEETTQGVGVLLASGHLFRDPGPPNVSAEP